MFDIFQENVTRRVVTGLYPGVTTRELDNLAAETCASMITKHHDYAILAARLVVSNLHKETKSSFSEVMEDLYSYVNSHTRKISPLINDDTIAVIREHSELLNNAINYQRDYDYSYFGFKV